MVANCARSGFRLWVFSILTLNDEIIITALATEMLDDKIYPEIRGCVIWNLRRQPRTYHLINSDSVLQL